MEQRERLIEIIQKSVGGCARNWAEIIADGLLADGWKRPPCKVRQTCYKVWNGEILEVKVVSIHYEPLPAFSYTIRFNSLGVLCLLSDGSRNEKYSCDIYLTREEAEREIERRKNEQAN